MNRWSACLALVAALFGCGGSRTADVEEPVERGVAFSNAEGRVDVAIDGKEFTAFHYEGKWDKPFLYPLRTASGVVVSRGYPLDERPGEHTDHIWHRGVWWGHGKINGVDFWRELGRDETGRLVLKAPPATSGNELTADLSLQAPDGTSLGSARETFGFSGNGNLRVIDATVVVHADQGVPITFGDTEDGGFGVRLSDTFRQDMGAQLKNAQGLEGAENIWGKNSEWVDYFAFIDNKPVGVAMFDHPQNLRHPTGWHARGYSLNAANPFAARDFTGDDAKDGSYTIPKGESLTLRYRVAIHEGPTDVAALYRQYADR